MTPERYNQVKAIFLEACEKSGEDRQSYLNTACGNDPELRRQVDDLLHEHQSNAPLLPEDPEGPLGPMSAILSHAGIDVATGHIEPPTPGTEPPSFAENADGANKDEPTHPHLHDDDAHDQTSSTRSGLVDSGRFPAGTLINSRYRIIELLGRGGMGEVYRADDITLNQSVALKFLPPLFSADEQWRDRFHNEIRLSRQVTHPNVCRVYDIGEYQGEQFLSMEYVDGENLASLLRRIGRVPHDKAVLLGRQLCAGIAAAHDRGVLHRDLKPANVMIDGRGSVRITDFGLAAPIDQLTSQALRAGTPAYMSPEQLRGRTVTVRSDVYSLGLVLYEMFTGRRAFRAENLRDYQKLHSSEEPTHPSEIIEDIDPIVERVILKCLEKDPKDRFPSVMAVSASLPGGNPLREILAAGETPSPEVVAAAGEAQRVMRPRTAWMLLLTAVACLIGFVYMAPGVFVIQRALQNTTRSGQVVQADPSILEYKAQEMLSSLGYPQALVNAGLAKRDWASGFEINDAYYLHVQKTVPTTNRLYRLWRPRNGFVYFWYRQSPEFLVPQRSEGPLNERDPAPRLPGMISLRLNPLGELIRFEAQPLQPAESFTGASRPAPSPATATAPASTPDWSKLLKAANLTAETGQWQPAIPQGTPPVYCDARAAWSGQYFRGDGTVSPENFRIEAAALRGLPVFFAVIGEHQSDELAETTANVENAGPNRYIQTAVIFALLIFGTFLAWKNYRAKKGDPQRATRMAVAFFILGFIAWLFAAHHISNPVLEFFLFRRAMGPILFSVAMVWIFYMALEPYVRRIWPETLTSWIRLFEGQWHDPLVGRDVLAGVALGVMSTLLSILDYQIPLWIGENLVPIPLPPVTSANLMLQSTENFGMLAAVGIIALYSGLTLLLGLVLIRMIAKRAWITNIIAVLLFAFATVHYRDGTLFQLGNYLSLLLQCGFALILLIVLTRHGLIALVFCLLARALLLDFPVTWDFAAWYRTASLAGILPILIILAISFYLALDRRRLGEPPQK